MVSHCEVHDIAGSTYPVVMNEVMEILDVWDEGRRLEK